MKTHPQPICRGLGPLNNNSVLKSFAVSCVLSTPWAGAPGMWISNTATRLVILTITLLRLLTLDKQTQNKSVPSTKCQLTGQAVCTEGPKPYKSLISKFK